MPTYQKYNFSSLATEGYVLPHSITSNNTHLWVIFHQFSLKQNKFFAATITKIDPSTPTTSYVTNTVSSLFPDDITNFYTSSEISPTITTPSFMDKFDDNLSAFTTTLVSDSASYGTFLNPNELTNFWGGLCKLARKNY